MHKSWWVEIGLLLLLILASAEFAVWADVRTVNTEPQLQQCVELISADGDTCLIEPGTYALTSDLIIQRRAFTLAASGGPGSAVINGNGNSIRVQANGVRIEGLAVSNTGGDAIAVDGANSNIAVVDNTITTRLGLFANGISFSAGGQVQGVRILGNEIDGGNGTGIFFAGAVSGVSGVEITSNVVRGMSLDGVAFFNGGNVENVDTGGSGCQINSTGQNGVHFANTGGVRNVAISRCDLSGNQQNGLLANNNGSVVRLVVQNSNVIGSGQDGLRLAPSIGVADLRVEGTVVSNNNDDGIEVVANGGADGVEIQSSELSRNGDLGLLIASPAADVEDVSISNNDLLHNGANGVLIRSATDRVREVQLVGNEVRGSGAVGVEVASGETTIGVTLNDNLITQNLAQGVAFVTGQDLADLTLQGNAITRNRLAGVQTAVTGSVSGARFAENDISQNDAGGLFLNAGNDLVGIELDANRLEGNLQDGGLLRSTDVRDVTARSNEILGNYRHGIWIDPVDNGSDIEISGNQVSDNDANNDAVGAGVFLDIDGDLFGPVTISGNSLERNFMGLHIDVVGDNASGITISDNTTAANVDHGIRLRVDHNLADLSLRENSLTQDGIAIAVAASGGSGNSIQANAIRSASVTGILLDATAVSVTENDVRGCQVGIAVNKAAGNHINRNNIANNSRHGVDAASLGGGQVIDAESNWWGEPSGPGGVGPGLGDAVTVNVDYDPWLGELAVVTGANFQITALEVSPAAPDVGETVTITATVENTGAEEGTQDIIVSIKSGTTIFKEERRSTPLNPAGSTTITVNYTFDAAGTYTVQVVTDNDTESKTVVVGGGGPPPVGKTIEQAIASLISGDPSGAADPDRVIGDGEILEAIGYWINGDPVPGTGGQTIDDSKMLDLISLWINGTPVSASALTSPGSERESGLSLQKIAFTGSRFIALGSGIEGIAVRVYDLAGRMVFADAADGNTLDFKTNGPDGAPLANGVYLYTVTVRGADGRALQSEVCKMALLR